MAAKYNFRKTILHRLKICWNVLTHKTFIAYTTDDIGDKWSLINNIESLDNLVNGLQVVGIRRIATIKVKRMKHKLRMIWRILRDRQVVVITESYGRMYYDWDTRSLGDVCQMCCEAFDKAKEVLDKKTVRIARI